MGERVARYLLARLREPSTWRGIILLATALGVQLRPEVWDAIVVVGLALAGGVGALAPDQPERLRGVPAAPDAGDEPVEADAWRDVERFRGGD